ncbi:MAG: sensor histidine kinase [Subdoligranulum sp.]|nr:sensor histidine kinase [Subdoligranulum sp.]
MQRLLTFCRDLRVRTKFLLILLLAIALVSTTALATLRIPLRAYDEQLYQNSAQMITLFAAQIQNELQDYEAISARILSDNTLQKNLSIMKNTPPGTVAWVDAQTEVTDRVAYFSLWFSNTVSFQLKTAGGASFGHFFGPSLNTSRLTSERIEETLSRHGQLVWLAEEGDPPRLILLREIREIQDLTLETLATVLIEVDFPALVEQYLRGMTQMGSPLLCAIYRDGVCLYASNDTIRTLNAGENGYENMRLDGQNVLCVRYTASNGMQYVTLVDYGDIRSTTLAAAGITVAGILAATIFALLVSALLISSVVNHLNILLQKFDAFAASGRPINETDPCYQHRHDEIGRLHRHFDRMTREWDRMSRDKAEQQRLLQEKQIQQLRAQIRPHFLYNTLESIYCLAQSAADDRIAVMTDALGKLLRASLNDTRDIVTVAEDLQLTREYLRIQLIRYGERLRVDYEVPEAVMTCRIPAMTIQPLVENAIHHAAEKMLEPCVIRIGANVTPDGVDVIVEDNGPGMDEDILAKLESGAVKPEGLGIGMRNIHRRVQYAFSGKYGLRVQCAGGKTRIIVHLPDTRT